MLLLCHWLACTMGASGPNWHHASRVDESQLEKYLAQFRRLVGRTRTEPITARWDPIENGRRLKIVRLKWSVLVSNGFTLQRCNSVRVLIILFLIGLAIGEHSLTFLNTSKHQRVVFWLISECGGCVAKPLILALALSAHLSYVIAVFLSENVGQPHLQHDRLWTHCV